MPTVKRSGLHHAQPDVTACHCTICNACTARPFLTSYRPGFLCDCAEHSQDDPRAYEAELAARERTLGPDHPDVAESLTNIAILYNQRLEFAKAQPLYERALRIYEKARGPDHADVAHCLTDLAVLHLEQVSTLWLHACRW